VSVKVILWGMGEMAKGMAKMILEKKGLELVGAIAKRKEKQDMDLGTAIGLDRKLGILVECDAAKVLAKTKRAVVLHSTNSFVSSVCGELEQALNAGHDIITIAEEMIYPWASAPEVAQKLDRVAKGSGVSLLGTGINPGFIMDTFVIALTGVCASVDKITVTRINDLGSFGPTVMRTQGIGKSVREFEDGVAAGRIVGHIGFKESISLISSSLGWKLDEIVQSREPIIARSERVTPFIRVPAGKVVGCKHIAEGKMNGRVVIRLEHPQQIRPEVDGVLTGDCIVIQGIPNIRLNINPEVPGSIGTIAIAVNMIPRVFEARPGLVTMADLPLPSAIPDDFAGFFQADKLEGFVD